MTASGPLREILSLNTDLLANVLDGVTDADAQTRLHGTNPMAFLGAHLVGARFFMAGLMGVAPPNPIGEALADARSADDVRELPALTTILGEWRRISRHVERLVTMATREQLTALSPHQFPVTDPSIGAGLAFLLQHESYHIGQLGLLRRQLGYPALTYRRRDEEPA